MNQTTYDRLKNMSLREAYGNLLGMEAVEVGSGQALVRMQIRPELANIFGGVHGGAVFSLIDEAFQLACNTHDVLSVALNVSITYVAAPAIDSLVEARATEIHKTRKTATYYCDVREIQGGKLIATAQALAYRTGRELDLGSR